ncbi:hypothetical protein BGZ93_008125 [Podila epicladia]|nr:hypothetical protein BGZ92_009926 [Podila epicladia]KAG0092855.1 hypothetical protein BGZ93_008125 [Podila epicladia]
MRKIKMKFYAYVYEVINKRVELQRTAALELQENILPEMFESWPIRMISEPELVTMFLDPDIASLPMMRKRM